VEPTVHERYDRDALGLDSLLPQGPRIAVLGSTSFWHHDSERTCDAIGGLLACIPGLVLLTGGVQGIGEATGRSFFRARCELGQDPCVYHLLPHGEDAWDYGQTFFAGADMRERREILGRLSGLFLVVEGGPGVEHEVAIAMSRGAIIIPVGRSGGYAATLYRRMGCPAAVDADAWAVLGASESAPDVVARAVLRAVQARVDAAL
jgi:hypothetical protein